MANYTITIRTGTGSGAGSDANVRAEILGASGKRGPSDALDHWGNDRGPGYQDTYDVDFGGEHFQEVALERVTLYRDNWGDGAGWFVEWVTIEDPRTGLKWTATFNDWIGPAQSPTGWYYTARPLQLADPKSPSTPNPAIEPSKASQDAIVSATQTDFGEFVVRMREDVARQRALRPDPLLDWLTQKNLFPTPHFASIGGAVQASAVVNGAMEGGVIHRITNRSVGDLVAGYLTLGAGLEAGAGLMGAIAVGIWFADHLKCPQSNPTGCTAMAGWGFARGLTVSDAAGAGLTFIWGEKGLGIQHNGFNVPLGIVFTFVAGVGADVPVVASLSWPYTYIWEHKA